MVWRCGSLEVGVATRTSPQFQLWTVMGALTLAASVRISTTPGEQVSPRRSPSVAMLQITASLQQISSRQAPGKHEFKYPLRTIVINLDARRDRWLAMVSQLAPLNASGTLQVKRLQAASPVDPERPHGGVGAGASVDEVSIIDTAPDSRTSELADSFGVIHGASRYESNVTKQWSTNRNAMYVPFNFFYYGNHLPLSTGERNCAMSHIQAWHEIAKNEGNVNGSGEPTLILEDDAVLTLDFVPRLQSFFAQDAATSGVDMMYLGYEVAAPLKREVAAGIFEAEYLWTTIAYLLWPSGAKKLLEALPVNQPVDNFMANLVKAGSVKAFAASPKLVHAENSWDINSDIRHSDEASSFWIYRLGRALSMPLNFASRVSHAVGHALGLRSQEEAHELEVVSNYRQ
jgi:GR25 family glycosyltransferase involved in LPS biosynthesis